MTAEIHSGPYAGQPHEILRKERSSYLVKAPNGHEYFVHEFSVEIKGKETE